MFLPQRARREYTQRAQSEYGNGGQGFAFDPLCETLFSQFPAHRVLRAVNPQNSMINPIVGVTCASLLLRKTGIALLPSARIG